MENTLYALRLRLRLVKTQLNQTYQSNHTYLYLLIISLYYSIIFNYIILYYDCIVLDIIVLCLRIHVFQSGSKNTNCFCFVSPLEKTKYQSNKKLQLKEKKSNHLTSILVLTQPWIIPMLVRRVLYDTIVQNG